MAKKPEYKVKITKIAQKQPPPDKKSITISQEKNKQHGLDNHCIGTRLTMAFGVPKNH